MKTLKKSSVLRVLVTIIAVLLTVLFSKQLAQLYPRVVCGPKNDCYEHKINGKKRNKNNTHLGHAIFQSHIELLH